MQSDAPIYSRAGFFHPCAQMSDREPADLLIEARWLLPIAPATRRAWRTCARRQRRTDCRARACRRSCAPASSRASAAAAAPRAAPGLVNAAHARRARACCAGCWRTARGCAGCAVRAWPRAAAERRISCATARASRWPRCCAPASPLCRPEPLSRGGRSHRRCRADARGHRPAGRRHAQPWADDATAHLAKAERLWDEYRADPRVSLYFAPLVQRRSRDATLMRVRRVADELDARVAMDVGARQRLAGGRRGCAMTARRGPWQRLEALGLLRPGFTASSGHRLREDLEALGRHGASTVIACPQADLQPAGRLPVHRAPARCAQRARHRQPCPQRRPRCACRGALRARWPQASAPRGAAPGNPGGATALGLHGVDRLHRAGQGRRPYLPRPRHARLPHGPEHRGGDAVRRDAQPGERRVDRRARAVSERAPARLRRAGDAALPGAGRNA